MIFVHPDDITVPEGRFREHFPEREQQELEDSILKTGLIHPLTLEQTGDTWTLRAGARRFRVLKKIITDGKSFQCGLTPVPGGTVPAIEWGTLSPRSRLAVEVEENLRRLDFTFQERIRALAAYHQFRKDENPSQTAQQTATEVNRKPAAGSQISEITEALVINSHLSDPDVAKAKDKKEALRIIRKKADALHRAKLSLSFDPEKTKHRLIRGDAKLVLPSLPKDSFDVILTDPIYGVGADSFGDQFSVGHNYMDSPKLFEEMLSWACDETFRVAKERAHCYLFCDLRKFERIQTIMVLAGWKVFPLPLIWYKASGALPLPKHGPRRTYECILYAYKGDRETLVVKNDCIIKCPPVKNLRHGAQKPVALYRDLLSRSANPGDFVLDFMGGSGTILVAANLSQLVATYIEDDEESYNIALTRVHTQEIDDGAEEDDGLNIEL